MNLCYNEATAVLKKELKTGARNKSAWLVMLMFMITAISLVSLMAKGSIVEGEVLSAFYWTIIFFSATTSVDRLFIEEEFSGTIWLLRAYGGATPVLFGKMLYGFILLFLLSCAGTLLFFMLLDVNIKPSMVITFTFTLTVGVLGLAISGTFLGAISAAAKVKSGLFPVLMLPIMLPILLSGAEITAVIFDGGFSELTPVIPMILYDLILMTVSSILFDYVWYEDL